MKKSLISIQAPAKLNLRLKVTGKRPDGYHELVSVMVPVDLFDRLELRITGSSGNSLSSTGYEVPVDETNLVLRAVKAFQQRTGIDEGVALRLEKHIPVSAGLGGGSSDAAAVLLALSEAYGNPLSRAELQSSAVRLGADVPFFLDCRPSLARGIGEILEPLPMWSGHWYVIVTPPLQVSTAWVYSQYRSNELTRDEFYYIKNQLSRDFLAIAHILENDLETVTSARFPTIETIKRHLLKAGAAGVLMSGSGPSVFGVFETRQGAMDARQHLSSLGIGDVFAVTEWRSQGPRSKVQGPEV